MDGFVLVVEIDGTQELARRTSDQPAARISEWEWDYMAGVEAEIRKGYRAPVVIDTTGEVVS